MIFLNKSIIINKVNDGIEVISLLGDEKLLFTKNSDGIYECSDSEVTMQLITQGNYYDINLFGSRDNKYLNITIKLEKL